MSQPIFPKGTKVVKGKVVQRLQGSSRVKEQKENLRKSAEDALIMDQGNLDVEAFERLRAYFKTDPDFAKAVISLIQQGRTGPRLAPGQQSEPKISTKMIRDMEEGSYSPRGALGDPRQQRELPKVRPGRPRPVAPESREAFVDANDNPMSPDDAPPTYYGGAKAADKRDRRKNPKMEGRGMGPLAKIIQVMEGEKMPAPLLEQIKKAKFDPVELEKILALITRSKYGKVGERATGQSNAARQREKSWSKQQEEDYNSPDDLPF